MSLPSPIETIRDDGIIMWQYDFPAQNMSVTVQGATQKIADAEVQAYLDAMNAPPVPAPPSAVEIALGLVQAVTTADDFAEAQTNLAAAAAALPATQS